MLDAHPPAVCSEPPVLRAATVLCALSQFQYCNQNLNKITSNQIHLYAHNTKNKKQQKTLLFCIFGVFWKIKQKSRHSIFSKNNFIRVSEHHNLHYFESQALYKKPTAAFRSKGLRM